MSRTIKGTKAPGREYWKSRLHRWGEIPGSFTRGLKHRVERRQAQREILKEMKEVKA